MAKLPQQPGCAPWSFLLGYGKPGPQNPQHKMSEPCLRERGIVRLLRKSVSECASQELGVRTIIGPQQIFLLEQKPDRRAI